MQLKSRNKYFIKGCPVSKFKVSAFSAAMFLVGVGSSTTQASDFVAENGNIQLGKAETKGVVNALILSGQFSKEKLSAAHIDKAIKDYILYKSLAEEAQKAKIEERSDVKKLLELGRERTLSTLYLKQYVENLEIPDLEAVAYEEYILNKNSFKQHEAVHAQHILIKIDENEDAAKEKAESIRQKLLSGKHGFTDLAEEYSEDSSVKNNKGDLGFFPRGKMVPEFEDEAFSLKVGEVSKLVKSQFGFHIIQLIDRKLEKMLTFDEVKDDLLAKLETQYKRDAYNAKMRDTLMTPEFTVNEGMLEKIATEIKNSK